MYAFRSSPLYQSELRSRDAIVLPTFGMTVYLFETVASIALDRMEHQVKTTTSTHGGRSSSLYAEEAS